MGDLHKKAMPEQVLVSVHAKVAALRAELEPFFITVSPAELQSMPSAGDKSHAFIEKAYSSAKANPRLVPGYLDMGAYEIDFQDFHNVPPVASELRQLANEVEIIERVATIEAYHSSRGYYRNTQACAKEGDVSAAEIADELGERFQHSKPKDSSEKESKKPKKTHETVEEAVEEIVEETVVKKTD